MRKIIGLYVSKKCLDACIYVSTNKPIYKSFANDYLGHEEFIKLTKNQGIELIVCKPTRGCEDEICQKLYRNGQQIHTVNTYEFDSFSKSVNFCTTDKEDTFKLAYYGYKMQLTANYLYQVGSETLKKYQQRKKYLVLMLSNEKKKLNNSIDGIDKESIEKLIKFLQKEIANFDEKLNELIGGSQELQEKTKILETIPGIKSPQAKRSSIVDQPSTSSINQPHTKSQVIKSLETIFCSEISTTLLVDMVIDNDNYFTAVGRPQGYYGNKQVRHVIPYNFIVNAIKSILVNQQYGGYKQYLESILESTSSLMYKSGICLTEEQFAKLPKHYQSFPGQFQLRTYTKENVTNTYRMIYNMMIINELTNISEFTDDIKQYAEVEFQNKFKKYVQFGIKQYLDHRVDSDNEYAMTAFLEAITRMILSVSNQDINSAFPTEGNSICTEVRLYPNTQSAFDAGDNYILCSQATITKMIAEAYDVNKYNKCIRIVNNEGSRVQNASRALIKLNTFMDTEIFNKTHDTRQERNVNKLKMMNKEEYLQELYNKYNNLYTATKYNDLYAPTNSPDINKYYLEPLGSNNIEKFFSIM